MTWLPLRTLLKNTLFIMLAISVNVRCANATDTSELALQTKPVAPRIKPVAQQIEHTLHARVGYFVFDTGSHKTWHYHANDRFLLTSTFKVLACSDLLHLQEEGHLSMNQHVIIRPQDILSYAPVTKRHEGQYMSFDQLCQAGIQLSDNTAGNLILRKIGGPEALTRYIRTLGDNVTRLDRTEPSLNMGAPDDQRDTTTPGAMVMTLNRLALGEALEPESRHQLLRWMEGNKVTGTLLRAGLPSTWRIADKSGSGSDGARSVIAVIWPPQHAPVLVAFFMRGSHAPLTRLDAAIAQWAKQLPPLFAPPIVR